MRKQTRLDFLYSMNEVNVDRKVSLDVKDASIDQVLRQLMGDRFTWEYSDGTVIIKPVLAQQPQKTARISGTVVERTIT